MRRSGSQGYKVVVRDLSAHGCRIEFVDRPELNELVWLKFGTLESIAGVVIWIDGLCAGVDFETPIHAAVFSDLLNRIG